MLPIYIILPLILIKLYNEHNPETIVAKIKISNQCITFKVIETFPINLSAGVRRKETHRKPNIKFTTANNYTSTLETRSGKRPNSMNEVRGENRAAGYYFDPRLFLEKGGKRN